MADITVVQQLGIAGAKSCESRLPNVERAFEVVDGDLLGRVHAVGPCQRLHKP